MATKSQQQNQQQQAVDRYYQQQDYAFPATYATPDLAAQQQAAILAAEKGAQQSGQASIYTTTQIPGRG